MSGELNDSLDKIKRFYQIEHPNFFVFEDVKSPKSLMVTYSVNSDNQSGKFPYTISIHRKKLTNTLYTLNAMNRIIEEENGGVLDKSFQLNWELYRDCLITTSEFGYKIISLRLVTIVR